MQTINKNDTNRICGLKKLDGGAIVAFRLDACPVRASLQGIRGDGRLLLPTSIQVYNNIAVTVFMSGEPPTNETYTVTYMLDTEKKHIFQKMEVKEDVLFLDGVKVDPKLLP